MNDLTGIWAEPPAIYLTDLRHPVMQSEWTRWQLDRGRRYNSPMSSDRERRDFDRAMLVKYGDLCPMPARTKWQLKVYEILDQKEDLENRRRLAAAKITAQERVYVDEEL